MIPLWTMQLLILRSRSGLPQLPVVRFGYDSQLWYTPTPVDCPAIMFRYFLFPKFSSLLSWTPATVIGSTAWTDGSCIQSTNNRWQFPSLLLLLVSFVNRPNGQYPNGYLRFLSWSIHRDSTSLLRPQQIEGSRFLAWFEFVSKISLRVRCGACHIGPKRCFPTRPKQIDQLRWRIRFPHRLFR